MDKKELVILSNFRKNSRKNLTSISKKIGIPISTLFEKLKRYEKQIIRKHTSIINFNLLGFNLKVYLILKVDKSERDKIRKFLEKNGVVNNLYRTTNGSDFIIEGIFKNMTQFQDFNDDLESFKLKLKQQYYVLEDIKRESFLEDENLIDILA